MARFSVNPDLKVEPWGQKVVDVRGIVWFFGLLGDVPLWLDAAKDRKAADVFRRFYVAGWHPGATSGQFKMDEDGTLRYPGDPAMRPLVSIKHGDETVFQYEHSWVAIRQPDGSFEVDRMD